MKLLIRQIEIVFSILILVLATSCTNKLNFYSSPIDKIELTYSSKLYLPSHIIKDLNIDTCKIYKSTLSGELILEHDIIFDSQGLIIEKSYYTNGNKKNGFKYQYGYNGFGKEINRYFIPIGETYYERDTAIYNASNRLETQTTFSKKGDWTRMYKYLYKGNALVKIENLKKSGVNSESLYTYNKNNTISRVETVFPSHPQYNSKSEYSYDKKGNLVEHTHTDSNGSHVLTHKISYNNKGLEFKFESYDKDMNLSQVYIKEYNNNFLLVKITSYTNIKNGDIKSGDYGETIYEYIKK